MCSFVVDFVINDALKKTPRNKFRGGARGGLEGTIAPVGAC